jgi:hypothetical protein
MSIPGPAVESALKVGYLYLSASPKGSSVQQKVLAQIAHLREAGLDCRGLFFSTAIDGPMAITPWVDMFPVPRAGGRFFRPKRQRGLLDNTVRSVLEQLAGAFDLLYLRYPGASPGLAHIVDTWGYKLVLEHQSKEVEERRVVAREHPFGLRPTALLTWLQHGVWPVFMERRHGPSIRRGVLAGVSVTPEIAEHQRTLGERLTFVVGNGIQTVSFVPRQIQHRDPSALHLLFMKGGSGQVVWAGLDRLLAGMDAWQGRSPRPILHVVGKPDPALIGRTDVRQHGYLNGAALDAVFDQVDIGINHLGLHRIGLAWSSNLKTREYIARGLPFVHATRDADIGDAPFAFTVPADDGAVDIGELVIFADRVLGYPDHPCAMNRFAKEHLDHAVQMHKLAAVMRGLLSADSRGRT